MATLVSPGVSVTVTDESFFIPAAASTVPLIFIATADEKTQPDGITAAAGTYENNVIRTVSSLTQSTQLYGIPRFLVDSAGNPQHGDARNEYGLFALNQYLGIGNLAYVIRANVNLDDNLADIQKIWESDMQASAYVLENLVSSYINEYNASNGLTPSSIEIISTLGTLTPGAGYTGSSYPNVALIGTTGVKTLGSFAGGSGYTSEVYSGVPLVDASGIATLGSFAGGSGNSNGVYTLVPLVYNTTRIQTLGAVTPGAGYTDGVYTLPLTGGAGSGATATITVSGNVVTTAVIVNSGTGYLITDTLSATIPGGAGFLVAILALLSAGGGSGAVATITVAGGAVTAITVTTPGTGYSSGDNLTATGLGGTGFYTSVATVTGGTGSGATANITVTGGTVTAVTLVSGGTGYAIGNLLTATTLGGGSGFLIPVTAITGGVGTSAAATITVNATGIATLGAVTGGAGYANGYYPNTALTGGHGSGAKANITVAGGIVTAVTLVSPGSGYLLTDILSASPAIIGAGVGFNVAISVLGVIAGVVLTNPGTGYAVGDVLTATIPGGSGFTIPVTAVISYIQTVNESTFLSLASTATQPVWQAFSFKNSQVDFTEDHTSVPLLVYANGFSMPSTGTFLGLTGIANMWVANMLGSVVPTQWTPSEASSTLLGAADSYQFTVQFMNETSLGANDAARRVAIITALQASINSNTSIRSETYEYNLILCPGFPEVDAALLNLCIDIQEEAFVIGETPFNLSPEDTATWAATVARSSSDDIAYYYPHGIASNLDGNNVFIAASGIALQTMTYSDNVAQLWFAPAGTNRGIVTGVTQVGYISGTLGTATTFNEVSLNQGQRDLLYQYFTNINPIVFFPGRGIIVWGQKTSAPAASALDRINVRRLVDYIKRQLRKNTMSFVFEPNDALTRANLKAAVDAFLGNLIVLRGLYDFATVCDETNNTPAVIDQNEMFIDVALQPVIAAEFIYIPIRIVATGAQL